jgi:hypothetical protein
VVGDLEPGAVHILAVGGKSLRLVASDAGTLFAKGIALAAGDEIRLSRAE